MRKTMFFTNQSTARNNKINNRFYSLFLNLKHEGNNISPAFAFIHQVGFIHRAGPIKAITSNLQ